jgi:hypothetical protein
MIPRIEEDPCPDWPHLDTCPILFILSLGPFSHVNENPMLP